MKNVIQSHFKCRLISTFPHFIVKFSLHVQTDCSQIFGSGDYAMKLTGKKTKQKKKNVLNLFERKIAFKSARIK